MKEINDVKMDMVRYMFNELELNIKSDNNKMNDGMVTRNSFVFPRFVPTTNGGFIHLFENFSLMVDRNNYDKAVVFLDELEKVLGPHGHSMKDDLKKKLTLDLIARIGIF